MVEGNMASLNGKLKQPEQAIYFGKQSVNGFQSLRAGMTGLDKELQQGFLKQHEGYYTPLAGWLIDVGRLAEAQQVTAMLKEQELFELVRRGAETDPRSSHAVLTGFKARQQQQRDFVEPLATATRGLNELEKKARTEPLNAQEPQRRELSAVRGELDAIVGAQGLPGRARFDEEFTAQSVRDAIQERPPALHIASHFVLRPGSESDSFLVPHPYSHPYYWAAFVLMGNWL